MKMIYNQFLRSLTIMKCFKSLILLAFTTLLLLGNTTFSSGQPALEKGKRLQQFKKMKLMEVLDLNEEQSVKFFARYNDEQKKVMEAHHVLEEAMEKLHSAVKSNETDKIKALTDEVLKLHSENQQATSNMIRSLRPLLDDIRFAKLVLFESKFQKELQKTLWNMKREHHDVDKDRDRR